MKGLRRPRILYLTPVWPRGKSFGGQLRALHIGRALKQIGDVKLLVVSSDRTDPEVVKATAEEFKMEEAAHLEVSQQRGIIQRLRWGFNATFLNIHGCTASTADQVRLSSLIPNFDLVWLMNSRTPNILMRWHWPHSHLDIDDVPSTYWTTAATGGAKLHLRIRAQARGMLLKRRERLYAHRFTTQSVCSESDRVYLGGGERIHVIPNGYARPRVIPERRPEGSAPRIGFIGLYSYSPNREGVAWFLRECWPLIRAAIPGIRFRVIGEGTSTLKEEEWPDVDALGWMDDPSAEISTWAGMIVPIHVGGGTRIKIVDAFSRKCPVVATRFGAYGYDLQHGQQLFIADSPEEFASGCVRLVKSPDEGEALAERAWNEFLKKWTWDAISPKVWGAAEECLRRSKPDVQR